LDRRVDTISVSTLEHQPAAALVDPDRQSAAARLASWFVPGWFATIVFQIVVLVYFWQSGAAARLRDRFRRNLPGEVYVRFMFGAVLVLIARLAALVPGFYIFRIGRVMGLSGLLLRDWAATWLLNTIVAMAIAGVVVAIVLWLADRTHQWYIYTMIAIVAGSFALSFAAPTIVAPSFDRFRPLPVGIAPSIEALEARVGLHVPIFVDERSGQTHLGDASVQGMGPTTRVLIASTIVDGETPAELRFVAAHTFGEIVANDPIRIAAIDALLVIFGVALAVFVADRIRFRRDDDPVSRLGLVAALLACVYLIMAPIDNAILRSMSANADRYALALTGDRAAAVRVIVRETDQRLDDVCPDVLTRLFVQTTPPAGERVAAINAVPSRCP
jgi:STE24 endopeptidase